MEHTENIQRIYGLQEKISSVLNKTQLSVILVNSANSKFCPRPLIQSPKPERLFNIPPRTFIKSVKPALSFDFQKSKTLSRTPQFVLFYIIAI